MKLALTAFLGCFVMTTLAQPIDIALTGREATAVHLAVNDFLNHRYSKSGDLSRYSLRIARSRNRLEVTFVPDTDPRGPYPGGGTAYGPDVTYYLSLRPPKIIRHLFGQ